MRTYIARRLLLFDSRLSDGLGVERRPEAPIEQIRAQLVIAQLRKVGIRGTLKTHESAAGYASFGKGDFQMIATHEDLARAVAKSVAWALHRQRPCFAF